MNTAAHATYKLEDSGRFVIENYNHSKPFSNFFPGVAGLWGIPMWVFYVNRGQGISSFGIEAKDKAILEFQPANKAYRLTSTQGFRTFLKVKSGNKEIYWEPFQENLLGTQFKKSQKMSIAPHDLTIEEVNKDLGLTVRVNYFTMPEEDFPALIRTVTVENTSRKSYSIEMLDGLPVIVPYGLTDGLNKNIARTVEAWVKVRNLKNKAPYYQLNVEVADTSKVTYIKEGNFYCSFKDSTKPVLLTPIVEAAKIFGKANDFAAPAEFLKSNFRVPTEQQTSNRTPCAMSHLKFTLKPKASNTLHSVVGQTETEKKLNQIVKKVTKKGFLAEKAAQNQGLIDHIKNYAFTHSSSNSFDMYSEHTFLDNVLRGGLPVSIATEEGNVAFNVYSRKHGDLERDYNYFVVAPTYYSQGNGNYRDVNQNRRNDVWFNADVKDTHLTNFLNLSQVDGYNPLVVRGTAFSVNDKKKVSSILTKAIPNGALDSVEDYVKGTFLPGNLLKYIMQKEIKLAVQPKKFLGQVLESCRKQELADHGEGFWTDHWTYNLDLLESYLSVYPDELQNLLLHKKSFVFYQNNHYVLPRDKRYVLTEKGVRQYKSVSTFDLPEERGHLVRTESEKVYSTHLAAKLLCLITNKIASLDPSGVGVEMEADKPNWYDAINGLPGLLGSSISETFEIKRYSLFLLDGLKKTKKSDFSVFAELLPFMKGVSELLKDEKDAQKYWDASNSLKEAYRQKVRKGISGEEKIVSVSDVIAFLERVVEKIDLAEKRATDSKGFLGTYFFHEVTDYKVIAENDDAKYVQPLKFKMHVLPQFLEGYVHAMRVEGASNHSQELYKKVRQSPLFDRKLKMYKVNANLSSQSEEIGRTRIFPSGWLENESIWLHMEYKFILELLRCELYEEFYNNFENVFVPFLNPDVYGRSTLENSSFIVSSAHEDPHLHGQGFVARLSGSTAEFIHIWLYMNIGKNPFVVNDKGELCLEFKPALKGWLFTKKDAQVQWESLTSSQKTVKLPKNTYAFNLLASTLVVYHNPKRLDTFGKKAAKIHKIDVTYNSKKKVSLDSSFIPAPYANDIRDRKVERIDVYLS